MCIKNHPKIPLITEIQRFCLQDGPGFRTTIFLKGCPLHCPWCHNPETQSPKKEFYYYPEKCSNCGRCAKSCPTGASTMKIGTDNTPVLDLDRSKCIACMQCVDACLSSARAVVGQNLTIDTIMEEALADQPFFKNSGGGVTISGGDPLLFPDFTLELVKRLKKEGLHVAIETSCFQKWDKIRPLLSYVDLFLVDIKSLISKKHKIVVGWPLEPILENIKNLIEKNANLRIHLPIIPNFNDSMDDFKTCEIFLSRIADRLMGVDILPYHVYGEGKYNFLGRHDAYACKDVKQSPSEKIEPLVKALKRLHIKDLSVGGLVGMGGYSGEKSKKGL
ncbi:glycyl-radical enzyme activating protein [Desulfobacula toluolica]|uniref:BssD: benzylsuccinate synthase activating enzyme n=1 Tax=Desulfobacula toluolica (strain DSM 7467 / Tol2) TaxID=651182 RepID=K0NH30_DESTT|nr:glycyl-radical enzyme activating protein [Desulfobacula toluolica]CCK78312.1 BssD: benzylsuccinate synthase activating enzyme [Desulfobacula toluolica Tol2]